MKGLLAGLLMLGLAFASMMVLSRSLQRLPWRSLAQTEPELPPVLPERVAAAPEPGLAPSRRSTAGTVPLYVERRPPPPAAAAAARQTAVAAAPTARPGSAIRFPPSAAKLLPPAMRLQAMPAFDSAAGAGADAGAAPASAPAATSAAAYAPPPEPADEPAETASSQGAPAPSAEPAAPKRARAMRAVSQSNGSAVLHVPPSQESPSDDE